MTLTLQQLLGRYDMRITGAIHLGGHIGEEAEAYHACKIDNVVWIEGNPDLIPILTRNVRRYRKNRVIQALVYDQDDQDIGFNITNMEGMSSSVLEFGTHAALAPACVFVERKTLRTKTLDTLVAEHGITGCNFLSMDLQGAELLALKGAVNLLPSIDYVFTEFNVDELYLGCVRIRELDNWLDRQGFLRLETQMAENHVGWGDALYLRRP